MLWNELSIEIPPKNIDEAIGFFNEIGILSLNIEDPNDITEHQNEVRWDYIDEEILNRDMTKAFVKAYIEEEKEAQDILKKAQEKGFKISINKLKAEDWENGWKKYYKPFKIGQQIVIVPAWEEYEKKEGEKTIVLDSGMAFGTGTHETTKMCVSFIEQYMKKDAKVLDIGTGSGILSICAGLFGSKDITGIDIDELAVKIANENIKLNEMDSIIKIKQGDLFQKISGKFDMIIANIVADIIKELLPQIHCFLKEDGLFLASGIISEREDEVVSFAKDHGFRVENLQSEGGWNAMVLKK